MDEHPLTRREMWGYEAHAFAQHLLGHRAMILRRQVEEQNSVLPHKGDIVAGFDPQIDNSRDAEVAGKRLRGVAAEAPADGEMIRNPAQVDRRRHGSRPEAASP